MGTVPPGALDKARKRREAEAANRFDRDRPGDPHCVCQGKGLVCRLGPDLKPDPTSIEICDCILNVLERMAE